ncbi:MAG: UDP-N-acetylglucosamine--N-acetylmuramyl-(pentapeptide) pyrophosphoryl-undecaprenol N-acetylglucosamine transferase, partial [Acidobacteriaceae bacterium]
KNAGPLVQAQAAELLPQSKLAADSLAETLVRLFTSRDILVRMGANAPGLAHPGAARRIAEMAVAVAR